MGVPKPMRLGIRAWMARGLGVAGVLCFAAAVCIEASPYTWMWREGERDLLWLSGALPVTAAVIGRKGWWLCASLLPFGFLGYKVFTWHL